MNNQIPYNINKSNFWLLINLRNITIIIYGAAFLFVFYLLDIFLPLKILFFELSLLAIANIYATWRFNNINLINIGEIFLWLLIDICFLSIILIQTGGPSNPFIVILIVPLLLGTIILPRNYAWGIFSAVLLALLVIEFLESPFVVKSGHHTSFFDIHVQGTILAYTITAAILVYFVTKVSKTLIIREQEFHSLKQQQLEEQHVIKLGLLSAGAAHELGGPLSVLSVMLRDWQDFNPPKKREILKQEISTMINQVENCKNILNSILANSGNLRGQGASAQNFKDFIENIAKDWQKNTIENCKLIIDNKIDNFTAVCDLLLQTAIINILDNAKAASLNNNSHKIILKAFNDENNIIIEIEDFGTGLSQEIIMQIGSPNVKSNKINGHGVGIFLSINTLRTLGGYIEFQNKPCKMGAIVKIFLPINSIIVKAK